jgi:hypothetical protein
MPSPEDREIINEDGRDTEMEMDKDKDKDLISECEGEAGKDGVPKNEIDEEADGFNSTNANTNQENTNGGGWETTMDGRQLRTPKRYRQEIATSALDSLCCEGNYYRLLVDEDKNACDDDDQ